jgi:succinate dehydrogenase / fumarate reductase cytochrome b subunit
MIRTRVSGFVALRASGNPDSLATLTSQHWHLPTWVEGMKTDRPINLSLSPAKFSFPLAALASITHRITGVLLFVGIAFLLYLLDRSLTSAQGLEDARALLTQPLPKLLLIAIVATLIYHFVAGIKHLFLDFDIGDTIEGGKLAAQLTIGISIALIALAGAWLW